MIKKAVALLLLTTFLAGCSQHAVFLSDPPGAQIFVDGEPIGVTPCRYQYQTGAGGHLQVMVEKVGYETVRHTVAADKVDRAARKRWLAAGIVWSPLWIGTFFTKKLNEGYRFVLRQTVAPHAVAQQDGEAEYRHF
jgi:hypothetical protein